MNLLNYWATFNFLILFLENFRKNFSLTLKIDIVQMLEDRENMMATSEKRKLSWI